MIPIAYNVRSLIVRRVTTAATCGGIALAAFLFAAVQMFANGLRTSLGRSASPDVAIVLGKLATSEVGSVIDDRRLQELRDLPQVAEMRVDLVRKILLRAHGGGTTYVLLRGTSDDGSAVGTAFRLLRGRLPRPGADEAIVGEAVSSAFAGLGLGESFDLPRGVQLNVVGVFDACGSVLESEVWTSIHTMRRAYGSENSASVARVRLADRRQLESFAAAVTAADDDLKVTSEHDHYRAQSAGLGDLMYLVALAVVVLFSLAAALGGALTMHASVAHRRREIAVLRALGFTPSAIASTFLLECALIGFAGGALGAAGSVAMSWVRFSFYNFSTATYVAFPFHTSAWIVAGALILSLAVAVVGGLFPALGATRIAPARAMRA